MTHLPAILRLSPAFAFVGRAREFGVLRELLPRGGDEGRRVALIAGEPGSGKSRLIRELAGELADEGTNVLCGGCDAAIGAPYRPFVEILDDLVRRLPDDELADLTPATIRELSRLLPDVVSFAGETATPARADPDTERHRLHLAITDVLAAASRRAPLLLVIEDLHWADLPSLLLVRHLVRRGGDVRMLLVLTYRDGERDDPGELADTLIDIGRTEGVARLRLSGLSTDEIAEFVRRALGLEPEDDLVTALADLTGGNAFLLTELWRELLDTGSIDDREGVLRLTRPTAALNTPESVRAVVGQRLARLAAETTAMLEVAAIAGPGFGLVLLRRATGMEEGSLLDAVDEAERSGMVMAVPSRSLAYRFSHELVRRSVIDRLSARRRAEIHLRVGEALEQDYVDGERGDLLASLAHHFAASALVGGSKRAITYNLAAARAATAALAFGEASIRLQTALELEIPDPAERATTYLELGEVSHRAGRSVEALEAFAHATGLARTLGDGELLARAAIGFEEACWRPAIHDAGAVDLLQEASAALDTKDAELRVRLLGGLARALDLKGEPRLAAQARDESIAMARRRSDRRGLAATLVASYWSSGVSTMEEINARLAEALEIADELGDAGIRTEALAWRVPSFVMLQNHAAAREALRGLLSAAHEQSQPFYLHVAEHYGSALALCDGDLAEAEAAAIRSEEWSRLLTGRDASGVHGIQMFSLRREQGRLAELAPVMRVLAAGSGRLWQPGRITVLTELGMADEARRELRRVALGDLDPLRESLWLATLTYLTDACAALGEPEVAERLYPELAPSRSSNVMIGHLVACYGAADRYLGMLAGTLREWDLAEEHFEAALSLNRRLGARTWLAHTLYEYGRMLVSRGSEGDRARADALLGEAFGLAHAIGMRSLAARLGALGTPQQPGDSLPDGLTGREVEILRFVATGLSNKDIGRALFLSEHTIANHVRSILRKTASANRTEATAYAHRRGLVEP
jgi:DNA-binding CsgD family transcriptional regulator/RecA/RadA recombinase